MSPQVRPYRQVARAASTEDTRRRIVEAFEAAMHDRLMDDITLDQIAAAAGTTRQTVIRLFGGKEGLVEAFTEKLAEDVKGRRTLPDRATPKQAARTVVADYEVVGDFIIRMLAQEDHHPVLSIWLNVGRATHRNWIASTFAYTLPAGRTAREALITQLVVAADVYTWKLLRRDLNMTAEATQALMASMITKLLEKE